MKTFAMVLLAGTVIAGAVKADPAADKLFAEAKAHHQKARELRADALKKAEQVGNEEIAANRLDHEAHVEVARALAILKADKNKVKAHELRHEAHQLWSDASVHHRRAHNDRHAAAIHRHDAAELVKAAAGLKDQPAVAAALTNSAKRHEGWAKRDDDAAKREQDAAGKDADKARKLWTEAEKLDPQTHKLMLPPPAPPAVVMNHPAPPPSAAVTAIKK